MFSKDKLFFLYLSNADKIQAKKFNQLYFKYKTYKNFVDNIENIKLKSDKIINEIKTSAWEDKVRPIIDYMNSKNIHCVFYGDEDYPKELLNLINPPALLYYVGDLSLLKEKCLSVVGSRIPTIYGRDVTNNFVSELAQNKIVIISGMAEGIDGIAQNCAIHNESKTVAILGGGVDFIYPSFNADLYRNILKNGLIISEYPLSTRPYPGNFPERNRIIAALGNALLVIEAGKKSGTMSTVDFALELGKTVYAVPGNIFSTTSEGTNLLIKQGCEIALEANDILEEFGIFPKNEAKYQAEEFSGLEKEIIDWLKREDVMFCEFENKLNAGYSDLVQALTLLEISGKITKNPGNIYSLKR